VADADEEDEVDDVEAPRHRLVEAGDAEAVEQLAAEQHPAAEDDQDEQRHGDPHAEAGLFDRAQQVAIFEVGQGGRRHGGRKPGIGGDAHSFSAR
jgi:hypothetical protein